MKFKKNGGFTLVELIVVIAILAILAGVAVPAYSGYVSKANAAADQTLLGTINTAFGAACLENGMDASTVTSASISLTEGKVTGVGAISDGTNSVAAADMAASFARYYAGNDNSTFKTISSLAFDAAKHVFVDPATSDSVNLSYGGATVTISGSAVTAMQNSSFGSLGGAGLANTVAGLTGTFGADDELASNLTTLMGGDAAVQELLLGYIGEENAALLAPGEGESMADFQDRITDMTANAAVLKVAGTASSMDTDTLTSFLSTGSFSGNSDEKMAQAALAYGMYTAYANSSASEGKTLYTDMSDILYASKNDAGFAEYLKSSQADTDMEAYLATLKTVSDNSSSTNVTSSIVLNGFDSTENAELATLLTQLLGK